MTTGSRRKVFPLRIPPAEASQPQPGSPVFMRVRENPPPFTLRLLRGFVNSKSPVSTGFFRFSPVFPDICTISSRKHHAKSKKVHGTEAGIGSSADECRRGKPLQ
jgi:hypothetical protein